MNKITKLISKLTPREVLEINDKHRAGGAGGSDIIPLSDLKPGAATPWDFSRPTLVPDQGGHAKLPPALYKAAFDGEFPLPAAILQRALVDELGIVVAGGAAAWPLGRRDRRPGDFDFFIHNPTEGAARKAALDRDLRAAVEIILACALAANPSCRIDMYKTVGVVTFTVKHHDYADATKIQVIIRDYRSVGEILHSFDVGSCCVAYDGARAVLTTLGAWSYLHSANIVHPPYRSPTYEARLVKYFELGFMLVFPDLDAGALAAGETLALPHMRLECESAHGNFVTGQPLAAADPGAPVGGYDLMIEKDPECAQRTAHEINVGWLSGGCGRPVQVVPDLPRSGGIALAVTSCLRDVMFPVDFERLMLNAAAPRGNPHNVRALLRYGLTLGQALGLIRAENRALVQATTINPAAALAPFLDRLRGRYDAAGPIDWWVRGGAGPGSFAPRSETPAEWYGAARRPEPRDPSDRETVLSLTAAMAHMHTGSSQHRVFSDGFCALCQDFVVRGDPNTIILPCGHIFHWTSQAPAQTCQGAKAWVEMGKNSCPQCRQPWEALTQRQVQGMAAASRRPAPVEVDWRA